MKQLNTAHSINTNCFSHFKFIKTLAVQIIQAADYQKINSMKSTLRKKKDKQPQNNEKKKQHKEDHQQVSKTQNLRQNGNKKFI